MQNRILILSVFIVASCGLAYELIAAALSSYLLGDSILQFSSIIGCYLFAMGVGAHFSRYVREERVLAVFVDIELLIGLIGGFSAALLFLSYVWLGAPFRPLLYALVFLIGCLVGMEIPLVMRVLNAKKTDFSEIVSRVLSFDYLGALAVSLLFPLVLAPYLGITRSSFLFGLLNVAVAIWTIRVFRHELSFVSKRMLRAGIVMVMLLAGFAASDHLVKWGEKHYYGDEIIFASTTPYQRLIMTRWKDDLRLYINGNLQFSSRDEYRYHEALVHPVLNQLPWVKSVLVLGGGDGLALREILRYPQIEQITLVDLDKKMTDSFSSLAALTELNKHALTNTKVTVINQDAAKWLETNQQFYDAIIVDFPDPSNFSLGKLYSVPFYNSLKQHVSANGLIVVQSTSPYFAPRAFWCINNTLEEAGLFTSPYHLYVPSFGEWGFIIAAPHKNYRIPEQYTLAMRYLTPKNTRAMFDFPPDMQKVEVEANHLNTQALVNYFEQDWGNYIR